MATRTGFALSPPTDRPYLLLLPQLAVPFILTLSQESTVMTGNPKAPASTDTDEVVLSLDAEPAAAPASTRPTKLDRAPSSRNTVLDLPPQNSPAPEPSADAAPVSPLPAPVPTPAPRAEVSRSRPAKRAKRHQPMTREALIDAVFTAPGATEWLARLVLVVNGITEALEILTAEPLRDSRQVTHI
jgi:hypothetical protein